MLSHTAILLLCDACSQEPANSISQPKQARADTLPDTLQSQLKDDQWHWHRLPREAVESLSILGDIHEMSGHGPGQPALHSPA